VRFAFKHPFAGSPTGRQDSYAGCMSRLDLKTIFTSYAVAWIYLVGFVIAGVVSAVLSPHDLAAFTAWASTSVHNLRYHPVGSLVVSAFFAQEYALAWPALIALALFGANKVLGNWRTVLVCVAGQVIGTLVSEGIVGYRVSRGLLPASDRYLIDVGPSYVVVTAIMVALLYGSWLARAAAALDLALLVVVGNIFGGLSQLAVSAVGHVTAITAGVIGGIFLVWQLRRRPALSENLADVGTGTNYPLAGLTGLSGLSGLTGLTGLSGPSGTEPGLTGLTGLTGPADRIIADTDGA
jgi:hypothetical protein